MPRDLDADERPCLLLFDIFIFHILRFAASVSHLAVWDLSLSVTGDILCWILFVILRRVDKSEDLLTALDYGIRQIIALFLASQILAGF